jgi:hypothetical protein
MARLNRASSKALELCQAKQQQIPKGNDRKKNKGLGTRKKDRGLGTRKTETLRFWSRGFASPPVHPEIVGLGLYT